MGGMTSRILGSWGGVFGVVAFCLIWLIVGASQNTLTMVLSIASLTFTQLVLREQARDGRRQERKIDAIVKGVPEVDDSVCEGD